MIQMNPIQEAKDTQDIRSDKLRTAQDVATKSEAQKDGVQFSNKALELANLTQMLSEQNKNSEIRQERVEAARQQILEGSYRLEQTVLALAGRISSYVE